MGFDYGGLVVACEAEFGVVGGFKEGDKGEKEGVRRKVSKSKEPEKERRRFWMRRRVHELDRIL